jgi:hypothetical protein
MAGFCPNCGTPASDDAIFCGGCGTKLAEAIAAALSGKASTRTTSGTTPDTPTVPSAPLEQPISQPATPSATAPAGSIIPSKSGGCGQEILIVLLVFALLVTAGVGIAIYLAHQAK